MEPGVGAGAARKKKYQEQEPEPEPLEKKSGAGAAKKFAGSPALVVGSALQCSTTLSEKKVLPPD